MDTIGLSCPRRSHCDYESSARADMTSITIRYYWLRPGLHCEAYGKSWWRWVNMPSHPRYTYEALHVSYFSSWGCNPSGFFFWKTSNSYVFFVLFKCNRHKKGKEKCLLLYATDWISLFKKLMKKNSLLKLCWLWLWSCCMRFELIALILRLTWNK